MQTRHLSLRYKFLFLTTVILCSSILAYLALAIRLFDRDKTAYIYDNNAALVETLAEEATTSLLSSVRTLRLINTAYTAGNEKENVNQTLRALFEDDDQLVEVTLFELGENHKLNPKMTLVNESHLTPYSMDKEILQQQLGKLRALPVDLILSKGMHFQALTLAGAFPILSLAVALPDPHDGKVKRLMAASLRQDKRFKIFQRSSVYTTYLIDSLGNILSHSDPQKALTGESLAGVSSVQTILASPIAKGAQQFGNLIVAYKKLDLGGLTAVSEIPVDKAFVASRRLIEQTAQFALLILSLAFLVTILFTKRLTAALQKLYAATLRIAQGDLDVALNIKTRDEVGALSSSFQRMAQEIKRLLVETRDKARMEKELETAQLVQDNFFPKDHLRIGDFEIAAYFKPASECGGDWWGSIQLEDKLILLLGDATGHGVPAALMTAAAHSCATTLAKLSETVKNLTLSPSFIMEHLNAAIFNAGKGRIKMTFFVAVIDLKTGEVRYVNASHDMPLICRDPSGGHQMESASREDLDTLNGRPDPCLGQSPEVKFTEHVAKLGFGETALCFTDGLLEGRNPADEEFGEGRLLRAFTKIARQSAIEIREDLIKKVTGFFESRAPEDDITLLVIKRNPAASVSRFVG